MSGDSRVEIPVNQNDDTAKNGPEEESAPDEIQLTDEELVAICKERVCKTCDEKEQADQERLRSLAEMDNFKKRLTREKEDFCKFANEGLLAELLPVLDNMELALEHGGKVEACKDLVMGVDMTRKIFLDILARQGLTPVGEIGEPFNPEKHEAMAHEDRDDMEPELVCSVLQRGYLLKDRLLRPAKVTVSRAC
ncbi:nucleotide exchange factor GrpE [Oceanidesulfovibrio indonesiensis]|uniref:nucleotide exchange factor GrpE n=1 Tax=Oceanidesulfovibrio indonesiensis TaxID=54767 RepID=UPI001ABFF2B3|nr:nucleotide exchange factor GrpE [Oceanidesulfovibrio indonesiensis]